MINILIERLSTSRILLSVSLLPLTSENIPAYIDPGTGSLIIQILLAALVGAGFATKIFWAKIKSFFSKVFGKKRDDSDK